LFGLNLLLRSFCVEMYSIVSLGVLWTLTDIAAYPESVNVLSDITSDVRTPDKLIDGVNDSTDGRHTWLAPILPNIVCLVCTNTCC